ncbi:conserved domain-containing protein, partial [Geodermatophilus africanus]
MIGTDAISRVIGKDVYDQSGDKIGSAAEVYLDDDSGQPEWVTVRTGLFGTKESFVPLRDADLTDEGLRVPVSKSQVKDAPRVDTDGHLSPQEEQELYRYYGLGSGQGGTTDVATGRGDSDRTAVMDPSTTTGTAGMAGGGTRDVVDPTTTTGTAGMTGGDTRDVIDPSTPTQSRGMTGGGTRDVVDPSTPTETSGVAAGTTGMGAGTTGRTDRDGDGVYDDVADRAVGRDTSGPTTDDAMTRSEERLNVGTRSEEVGRARLRKYVVTENVSETVPVSREEVRVEREPITDANVGNAMDGPAISEEEHEVTLRAERPVVEKEAVPVERIRL